MRNDLQNMQKEQDIEKQTQFTDESRLKRRKRRRRSRIYLIAGLTGCLILLVAMMYAGLTIWEQAHNSEVEDALAEVEEITYSQEDMDAVIAEATAAAKAQADEAARQKEAEILDGIKHNLELGTSTVETLRPYYPNDIVLVSGGEFHFVPIREELKHNSYEYSNLNILETGEYQYTENGQVVSHKGIDVSKHQGKINWQKVADDGVEFAFIRAALRGYGTGKLVEDEYFEQNIKGALGAGIKVGVYVYSQAINEEELLEEADFVLKQIAPYKIECPVVYDVEMVSGADGRMNSLSVEERTKLTALFCQTIEQAGYRPMIYHNMETGVLKVDLEELENYDKWFAYYNPNFYYPYAYDVWQYSEKGRVNGIETDVDLNISFVPLWEE